MPIVVAVFLPLVLLAVLSAVCFAWGCETGYWQAVEDYSIDVDALLKEE